MRISHPLLASLLVFAHACTPEPSPAPEPRATAAAIASVNAAASLNRIDTRTPVPLLPMMANHQKQNMRDHLVAVQEIITAMGAKDFDAVEASTRRMGYSEQ